MKSYALAITLSMLISAIYAIQNTQEITVRFLFFEGVYAQGVVGGHSFSAGAVLMWFFFWHCWKSDQNIEARFGRG